MHLFGICTGALFVVSSSRKRSRSKMVQPMSADNGETQPPSVPPEQSNLNMVCTESSSQSESIPSTPCVRICRYNANVYDGQVCIGCFRDVFEISNWSRMTPAERTYALLDAADRHATTSNDDDDDDVTMNMEGSITREELLRQADVWRQR
jgi:predicted Fe-S protein YdhL (DUF1289 family)